MTNSVEWESWHTGTLENSVLISQKVLFLKLLFKEHIYFFKENEDSTCCTGRSEGKVPGKGREGNGREGNGEGN